MKVWNYMIIMLSLILFLNLIGIPTEGSDAVLSSAGIVVNSTTGELVTADVGDSAWYTKTFGVAGILVVVLTGGAIIVGFFTKNFEWKLVLLPFFSAVVIGFVATGKTIIDLAIATEARWLIAVIATIFLPLTAMFIVSVVEWFGGTE